MARKVNKETAHILITAKNGDCIVWMSIDDIEVSR
jgi:hypothetical protein